MLCSFVLNCCQDLDIGMSDNMPERDMSESMPERGKGVNCAIAE